MVAQIHIMVFICALTHIFLSCMVLLLSDLRVREWRRWRQLEDEHINQCASLALICCITACLLHPCLDLLIVE